MIKGTSKGATGSLGSGALPPSSALNQMEKCRDGASAEGGLGRPGLCGGLAFCSIGSQRGQLNGVPDYEPNLSVPRKNRFSPSPGW
jgi:hypothetical protein